MILIFVLVTVEVRFRLRWSWQMEVGDSKCGVCEHERAGVPFSRQSLAPGAA